MARPRSNKSTIRQQSQAPCRKGYIWNGTECVPAFQPYEPTDYDVLQDIIDINNLPQTVDEFLDYNADYLSWNNIGGELPPWEPPNSDIYTTPYNFCYPDPNDLNDFKISDYYGPNAIPELANKVLIMNFATTW